MRRLEGLLSPVFGDRALFSEAMYNSGQQCPVSRARPTPIKVATWNIGSVQTNPLEFSDDSDHRFTHFLAEFQSTAEALEASGSTIGDILCEAFPFSVRSSLLGNYRVLGLPSPESSAEAFDFLAKLRVWSGFLSSKNIGDSRIISWPDRFTNVFGNGRCRPSMISCYTEELSPSKAWLDSWIRFMADAHIPTLSVEKYNVASPYRENYRAFSVVGLAVFDSLLIAIAERTSVDWRDMRLGRIKCVSQRPQQLVNYIVQHLLRAEDVIMLQEVSDDIQSRILSVDEAEGYELIAESNSSGAKQRSVILIKKGCGLEIDVAASERVREAMRTEGERRGLASGDLSVAVVSTQNDHPLLLASFHGDTNGRLTIPTLKVLSSLGLPLLVGVDANCYANPTPGNLAVVDFLKAVTDTGLYHTQPLTTTRNLRTPLQAQSAKTNVFDENPKDYILLTNAGMTIEKSSVDDGGSGGHSLPNLRFPSDHAIVEAETVWSPMVRVLRLLLWPLTSGNFSNYNAHLECPGGIDDCLTEDFFRDLAQFQATYDWAGRTGVSAALPRRDQLPDFTTAPTSTVSRYMREDLNLSQYFLTSIYRLCVEPYLDRLDASGGAPKCPAPLADIMLNALLALETRFEGPSEARELYQRAVSLVTAASEAGDSSVEYLLADWQLDTPYTYPALLGLAQPSPESFSSFKVYVYEPPEEIFTGLQQSSLLCGMGQWGVEVLVHKWLLSNANRTKDPSDADLFYVPVYGTCLQTRNGMGLQSMTAEVYEPLFKWLLNSPWWQRRDGADHIFLFADGQGAYQFTFYDILRPNPILLLVEGRCPTWNEPIGDHLDVKLCYSPWKDIIIPGHTDHGRAMYMRQHARPLEERDILLTFHGRHGGVHEGYKRCEVRNALVSELSQYPDVSVGGFIGNYLEIKGRSRFCMAPAGTSPWTNHLYESFFAGCIPVILSDDFILPFTAFLNWSQLSIRWPEERIAELYPFLKSIPDETVATFMHNVNAAACWFDWWSDADDCSPYVAIANELGDRASRVKNLGVSQNSAAGKFWNTPEEIVRRAGKRRSRFHVYSEQPFRMLTDDISHDSIWR
ncbi:hypothetical protein FOL46_001396 [Perkinsus olseni]|uniref:Exostosin GT47 domain-containing protein n=1 Tax=Perkinsus olseni TaxID=32597 RepID=A0A7J6MV19_PEROL|nr:hypothetical protein FOL46_001396 [Perkinsus olseni]